MGPRQRSALSSTVKQLSLFVAALAFLLLPCNVLADSMLLVRIVDSIDLAKLDSLKDLKLSAVVKMDGKGDLVVNCLNLSLPMAHTPFKDNMGMQKLLQRSSLEVEPKGKGVMVKLAFLF